MTDTGPDYPGDVDAPGQRMLPNGTFPLRFGRIEGAEQVEEVVDESNPPPTAGPPDPCADLRTAVPWNADAAAAKAAKEFARLASERNPPETLNDREWAPTFTETQMAPFGLVRSIMDLRSLPEVLASFHL